MTTRNWIREARRNAGMTQTQLAERAGTTQSNIQKLENGLRPFTQAWAARFAQALGVTPEFLMFGNPEIGSKIPSVDTAIPIRNVAPVLGAAGAGGWMDVDELPGRIANVATIPGRYEDIEQYAYKVVGDSMNAAGIPDGSYVVCVREDPRSGDIVVFERRRGQLFQRSVKEAVWTATHLELRPHSTDPAYKPLRVPRDERLMEDGDTEIVFVGRVIASVNYLP